MSTVGNEVEIIVVTKDKTDFNSIGSKVKAAGEAVGKGVSNSIKKGIGDVIGDVGKTGAKAGESIGSQLTNSLEKSLSSTGPGGAAVTAALVGVVAGAAPFLGAVIAGSIIGGAAGGGILGGLLLVKDDPRVKSAASNAGTSILNDLKVDAKGFVEPAVAGIGIIRGAFADANGDIASIFSKSATFIEPLANSAGKFITSVAGGLNDLVQGAGPVVSALGNGIEEVGDALADGFSKLGDDGASAGTAIAGAFTIVAATISATLTAVDALSDTFGFLAKVGLLGPGWQAEYALYESESKNAKDAFDAVGDSITQMGEDADASASQLRDLSDALQSQYDPAFALIDAQNQLSKAQDDYDKAVSKSGENSTDAQRKLTKLAEAALNLTDATASASGAFDGQLTPAMEQVLRTAGFGDAEIAAFRRQLANAQTQASRTAGSLVLTANQARNLASAVKGAAAALASLHSKTVDINIDINTRYFGKPFTTSGATGIGGNNYTGHAYGGVVGAAAAGGPRGNMTLVGEQGPELVDLAPGSMVTPASATRQKLQDWAGGGNGSGGGSLIIQFAGNLDSAFATAFQKMVNAGLITIKPQYVR